MKNLLTVMLTLGVLLASAGAAHAKVKSQAVTYQIGKDLFEGYLSFDDASTAKRPGVLVVHDWYGVSDQTKKEADKLAELGYVAFAADIYGKGVRPADDKAAGEQAMKYKKDPKLLRQRVRAAFDVLSQEKLVDAKKIAAIGFCFGGTTALELARDGAPLAAVVSFHGGLATANPADAKKIKGKVLVLHGADDPHVKPEEVAAFEKEMRDAKVDWQLYSYGGAVHAFTVPAAGNDPAKGAAYNAKADARSHQAMKDFFLEVFGPPVPPTPPTPPTPPKVPTSPGPKAPPPTK
jgi:dienelactone hydrolase